MTHEATISNLLQGRDPVATYWAMGLEPDPELLVSEWSDQYRELSSRSTSEPGRYRTSRTPYLKEIMDNLSSTSPVESVIVMKSAQIGFTEAGQNWLGYIIHKAPGPALYVQPTIDLARRTSRTRIAPMIEECPVLADLVSETKSRDAANTILAKDFTGGVLVMTGANSATGLRSMPVRYLFLDEIDGYPMDVGSEGDPIELAMVRTKTFTKSRKILMGSTPTVKGLSRIESRYEDTDKRKYFVPCPHCGHYQHLVWGQIKWPKGETEHDHIHQDAHYECGSCGEPIQEHHKTQMMELGEWRPTAKPLDPNCRGYHINALYSPLGWYSWADAVLEHLKAKRKGTELLKVWINTVLGESWEEGGAETLDPTGLMVRREPYAAEVPDGVLLITGAVDVQDDRLEYELAGWGEEEEYWGLLRGVVWGDPGSPSTWEPITDIITKRYKRGDGSQLAVTATCVDTGGHYTTAAYAYVKKMEKLGVFAIKGMAGETRPIVTSPTRKRTGRQMKSVNLFTVGVDPAKTLVHYRLSIKEPGPGYCHFPIRDDYGESHFSQLTAEKKTKKFIKGFPKWVWVKVKPRNESLDLFVYNFAALVIVNPSWPALKARRDRAKLIPGHQSPTAKVLKDRSRKPRRTGFVQSI
jgi:phage terminase large subunit GpA-like protein